MKVGDYYIYTGNRHSNDWYLKQGISRYAKKGSVHRVTKVHPKGCAASFNCDDRGFSIEIIKLDFTYSREFTFLQKLKQISS